jgi:hypothetical protein
MNLQRLNSEISSKSKIESKSNHHSLKTITDNRPGSIIHNLQSPQKISQFEKWSTGKLDGLQSDVTWNTGKIKGSSDTVGLKMVANPLGPEHLQGSPPKSGEQSDLMGKLETDPDLSAEDKYIRGHLLNDNIGGPGVAKNLFPITARANSQHLHNMEETVKKWVNDDKHWVSYKVEVKSIDADLDGMAGENYVNGTFSCKASILDPDNGMKPVNSYEADIVSVYEKEKDVKNKKFTTTGVTPKIGIEAMLHTPLLSKAKAIFKNLDSDLQTTFIYCFEANRSLTINLLRKVNGIGAKTVQMLEILSEEEKFSSPTKEQQRAISKVQNKEINVLAALAEVAFRIEEGTK